MSSIKLFENKHVRSQWDAEREAWYYSIVDVVASFLPPTEQASLTLWSERFFTHKVSRLMQMVAAEA